MKKWIRNSLIVASSIILIIVVGIIILASTNDVSLNSIKNTITSKVGQPECEDVLFTAAPIDLQYLHTTTPLGNLNPSGHTFPTDHIYFDFTDDAINIPVYAPGDVTITNISSSYNSWADPPYTDYSINFSPCDGVDAYYIHVHDLSDKLQQAFDKNKGDDCNTYETGGRTYTSCWVGLDIDVSAGEIIAHTARQGQNNFDMGIYDQNAEPWVFANPDRWQHRDNYPYTMCPIDYYTEKLKAAIYDTFGGWNTDDEKRTIEPICGTVGQDVPGTAQGVWFLPGTSDAHRGSEDDHIALVHDNIDPSQGALSLGRAMEDIGIRSMVYYFTPRHKGLLNRELSEITPGPDVYCFGGDGELTPDSSDIPILLQLVDEATIRLGRLAGDFCTEGPWQLDQYVEFER